MPAGVELCLPSRMTGLAHIAAVVDPHRIVKRDGRRAYFAGPGFLGVIIGELIRAGHGAHSAAISASNDFPIISASAIAASSLTAFPST